MKGTEFVKGSGLGMLEAGGEAGGLALLKLGEVNTHPALHPAHPPGAVPRVPHPPACAGEEPSQAGWYSGPLGLAAWIGP